MIPHAGERLTAVLWARSVAYAGAACALSAERNWDDVGRTLEDHRG
jgi:hypothetical protein